MSNPRLVGGLTSGGNLVAIAVTDEGKLEIDVAVSGGGGDASSDNQATQIAQETEILNAIVALALQLPSAPVGDRLKTDGSGVTQPISVTSLPLPTNAATDATLGQIRDAIKAQIDIASTIWTDNSGAFYVRRDLVNESTATITVSFTDPLGNPTTPGAGLRSLAANKTTLTDFYDVLTSGTGYSVGDLLARVAVLDTSTGTTTASFLWLNFSLGTILSAAPVTANIESSNETIGVSSLPPLPAGTNIIGGVTNTIFGSTQSGTWNVGIIGNPSVSVSNANTDPSTGTGQTTTNTKLTSLDTKLPSQGQALTSASLPVVLPVSQILALTPPTTVGITGNPSVSVSNANVDPSTGTAQATTNTKLSSLDTKLPTQGQALISTSLPVVLPASQIAALTPLNAIAFTNTSIGVSALPSLPAGSNIIGAISNSNFGITGTLPAFTATPTFKVDQTTPGTTNKVSIGNDGIVSVAGSALVGNISNKFRDDFDGSTLKPAVWNVIQTGAGQTITVTNSELQVVGGVTANSQTIIRSLVGFTMPMQIEWTFYLSQNIINREIYFEITDSNGNNVARQYFTTALNQSNFQTINNGSSLSPSSSNVSSLTIYGINHWDINIDQVDYSAKSIDSFAASVTTIVTKTRFIPDPTQTYYLQIRFNNLATPPVSSTTLFIDAITVKPIQEVSVNVNNGKGTSNPSQAIPVNITPTGNSYYLPVSINSTIQTIDSFSSTQIQSVTVLAAGALYSGLASNTANQRNYIRGWVFTDQPGTLVIEQSTDNTVFRQTYSLNVLASTSATVYEHKVITNYYRFKFTNTGSSTQTVMQLISTTFNG